MATRGHASYHDDAAPIPIESEEEAPTSTGTPTAAGPPPVAAAAAIPTVSLLPHLPILLAELTLAHASNGAANKPTASSVYASLLRYLPSKATVAAAAFSSVTPPEAVALSTVLEDHLLLGATPDQLEISVSSQLSLAAMAAPDALAYQAGLASCRMLNAIEKASKSFIIEQGTYNGFANRALPGLQERLLPILHRLLLLPLSTKRWTHAEFLLLFEQLLNLPDAMSGPPQGAMHRKQLSSVSRLSGNAAAAVAPAPPLSTIDQILVLQGRLAIPFSIEAESVRLFHTCLKFVSVLGSPEALRQFRAYFFKEVLPKANDLPFATRMELFSLVGNALQAKDLSGAAATATPPPSSELLQMIEALLFNLKNYTKLNPPATPAAASPAVATAPAAAAVAAPPAAVVPAVATPAAPAAPVAAPTPAPLPVKSLPAALDEVRSFVGNASIDLGKRVEKTKALREELKKMMQTYAPNASADTSASPVKAAAIVQSPSKPISVESDDSAAVLAAELAHLSGPDGGTPVPAKQARVLRTKVLELTQQNRDLVAANKELLWDMNQIRLKTSGQITQDLANKIVALDESNARLRDDQKRARARSVNTIRQMEEHQAEVQAELERTQYEHTHLVMYAKLLSRGGALPTELLLADRLQPKEARKALTEAEMEQLAAKHAKPAVIVGGSSSASFSSGVVSSPVSPHSSRDRRLTRSPSPAGGRRSTFTPKSMTPLLALAASSAASPKAAATLAPATQADSLRNRFQAQRTEIESLKKSLAEAEQRCAQATEQQAKASAEEMVALRLQVTQSQVEVAARQMAATQLQTEVGALKNQLSASTAQLTEREMTLATLRADLAARQAELAAHQAATGDRVKKAEELQAQMTKAQTESDAAKAELVAAQQKVADTEAALSQSQVAHRDLAARFDQVQAEVGVAHARAEKAESDCVALAERLSAAELEADEARQHLADVFEEVVGDSAEELPAA